MTREDRLAVDIDIYNRAMEMTWEKDKVKKNLSGDLSVCKHCGRKYAICCICDEAEAAWERMLAEVSAVSNRDAAPEKHDEMKTRYRKWARSNYPEFAPQLINTDIEYFAVLFAKKVYERSNEHIK